MARPKRFATGALVLCACLGPAVLGGCTAGGGLSPTSLAPEPSTVTPSASPPTPTPPSKTGGPTDAQRAGEAVVRYWALVDQLAADPTESTRQLESVAAGQALAQQRVALDSYRAKGWRQSGAATVSDIRSSASAGLFLVSACVDVRRIDFLDASGRSLVTAERPPLQRFSYEVDKQDEKFVVVKDTLRGSSC